MTSNTQSDIEIYIKDCTIDVIKEWLETRLGPVTLIKQGKNIQLFKCSYESKVLIIEVLAEAVGKRFTCVWFQSSDTPWNTDLECARDAFAALNTEIRCSEGNWSEEEAVPEQQLWWRITADGEKQVVWN
ncbi:MAG: hypothetical protein H7A01_09350 [Hahellaceae bacterium]|nr:hypothetical protein [Hahellaceae bacterium]MCP5211320.1 hypothetical protein [Hahellaceae bacterium]